MSYKTFSFQNPEEKTSPENNWRQLQDNSKFISWEPTLVQINNVGSTTAYYQLYGPLVYYYIQINYDGTALSYTGSPRITNMPLGPKWQSGFSYSDYQFLEAVGDLGVPLSSTHSKATLYPAYVGATNILYLPTGTWASTTAIYVYGWIFRSA
jgi:hypothetical protein